MIARDEGRIDVLHCPNACVGIAPVKDQTRSPACGPTVVGAGVGEQATRGGVSFLIRGSVTEPTESQCEVRGVLMHRSEQFANEVEIAAFIARDSQLIAHAGKDRKSTRLNS